MARNDKYGPLVADILADSDGWQDAILAQTLRTVRRQRRIRKAGRMTVVAAGLLVLLTVLPTRRTAPTVADSASGPTALQVVATQPLRQSAFVSTTVGNCAIVSTDLTPVPQVSDDWLLARVSDHPAVLVRETPTDAALVFLSPEDQGEFLSE